jgi:magnesium chelatase family protein
MFKLLSLVTANLQPCIVEVESSLRRGLNRFSIVGLPDRSINEAKDRITSAILSSGVAYPYGNLIVNLSPSHLPKSGTSLDLAICLSLLLEGQVLPPEIKLDMARTAFLGELSLGGKLLLPGNLLATALAAKQVGISTLVLPLAAKSVLPEVRGVKYLFCRDLREAVDLIKTGRQPRLRAKLPAPQLNLAVADASAQLAEQLAAAPQLARVLAVAAAGSHSILLDGPPGSGKTTALSELATLMPQLDYEQALEVAQLHALHEQELLFSYTPPLRQPHHTISDVALIGGGATPKPGEITLAHLGILFLDEICEFPLTALEALREPLSTGVVNISRASYKVKLPARFLLAAARNPCPCGWFGEVAKACKCEARSIHNYQNRLSGALLDRIDIKFRLASNKGKTTKPLDLRLLRGQISTARQLQYERFQKTSTNANFNNPFTALALFNASRDVVRLYKSLTVRLSHRGAFKVLKLARTIADLDQEAKLTEGHVLEAFGLFAIA